MEGAVAAAGGGLDLRPDGRADHLNIVRADGLGDRLNSGRRLGFGCRRASSLVVGRRRSGRGIASARGRWRKSATCKCARSLLRGNSRRLDSPPALAGVDCGLLAFGALVCPRQINVQHLGAQLSALVLNRSVCLAVGRIEEVDNTPTALDGQRVRSKRQVLRLLQGVALYECEASVPDACDVAIIWVSCGVQGNVDDQRVLGQFVEVGYALDEDVARGGHAGELAIAQGLESREQWVGILANGENLWQGLADDRVRLVGGVLGQEFGELGVGGEGGLDRNDHVGGKVGDSGNWEMKSAIMCQLQGIK